MQRFLQMKMLQNFASFHANIYNRFSLERHLIDRQTNRERRSAARGVAVARQPKTDVKDCTASCGERFALD